MRVAVLYEHPEWFLPLFAALERRRIDVVRVDATTLYWDPAQPPDFSLLLNRMSPSAHTRGHAGAIHSAAAFIGWAEAYDVPVINGSAPYRLELSKSAQLDLLRQLNIPFPPARVINNSLHASAAAVGLRFPVIIKPNVGGSGAGILKFDTAAALAEAARRDAIDLGIDSTALVQEFLPARGGTITRLEFLAGELLYAIDITPPTGHGFNLCPADICQTDDDSPADDFAFCATRPAMNIAAATPLPEVVDAGRRIARAAGLDICGIEYLVDERDGTPSVYDINALSNFVTDARGIVGFDPFERFATYIEARLEITAAHSEPRPVTSKG